MEKLIISFLVVLVCTQLNAKKSFDWTMPEGELINVFVCEKDTKKTEVVRIYSSGQYEHLLYETKSGNKEYVLRITGNWTLKFRKITFLPLRTRYLPASSSTDPSSSRNTSMCRAGTCYSPVKHRNTKVR